MKKNKLFVLGSVNVDLSISCERLPEKGETITGYNFTQSLGGKGANQAFYSAELGLDTLLSCSIGNDIFGEYVHQELKKTAVELAVQRTNYLTGKAMIIKNENDNRIILDSGANEIHDFQKIKKLMKQSKVNYFLAQLEIPFQIVTAALEFAAHLKILTFLNPAPAMIKNETIYQTLDYLILNETECYQLSKIQPDSLKTQRQAVNYFLSRGVKHVVITLGDQGSYYQGQDGEYQQEPIKVKVKNTTGAGDSYIGALIWALSEQKTIQEAMKIATMIASQVCASDEVQVKNLKF